MPRNRTVIHDDAPTARETVHRPMFPPTIMLSPYTPCMECGIPSAAHGPESGIKHNDSQFVPKWAWPLLKTGICTNCNDAAAKDPAEWCGSCIADYWKERPTIFTMLVSSGKRVLL